MQIDTDKMAQQCIDAINDKIKNLKTLNIMVVGKSGVGKSTLINSLFRGNFAETGLGRPVTSEIRKKVKKDYPLAIYDTPGFELSSGQQNKVKDEILDIISKGFASKDINDAIHCIWYCVNVGGNRTFDESEINWLKEFTAENKVTQVPIIVVLTQAIPKKKAAEMKNHVEKENLDIVKVVPILAQDMDFDEEYIARAYGLDQLIDVMAEVLPNELQSTLQNVQKASLDSKKRAAQAVVAAAVAGSFGEGFAPIPFSDAALLIPTQVGMIAGITVIFGLDISKSFLTSFVSATIGSAGATILGKTIVSNLLKLIPGVGTVAGGLISGTTAGLLTTALGGAYIMIMEMVYKGEIDKEKLYTAEGQKEMTRLFKEELKKKK
ncbi:YcjF family protein [Acetoanaerobium noterae]|uniref:YcjF family protein n=1 Tax=Acetoanaerobium noterae TaxID=745369 RepID=UPI0028AAF57E|nr:GTPase [Acetoanaerobium noterae]